MDLLEREGTLRELDGHLKQAAHGSGRAVLLHGTAGAGKSAVARALAERAGPAVRVLLGTCDRLSIPRPLGPLVDFAPQAGEALRDQLTAEGGPGDMFGAMLADLRAAGRPTVLVFEDVHWADQATLDLLRYLARRIADTPALLVATYRDDEIGRTHPLTVLLAELPASPTVHLRAVPPLSRDAVARLAAGRPLDVDELYRVTGGNPFFVTEILASHDGRIPTTVREAVLARMARLSVPARETAEAAAVVGSRAAPWLVEEAVLETESALDECLASGVLRLDGEAVRFRHELARMVVLADVPPHRRAATHRAVLEALRSRPPDPDALADLAHHAEEAGDEGAVLVYARRAAAHAAALRSHREAAAQYQRVLRHGAHLSADDRADLLEGRSYECYLGSAVPEAIASRREALELRREVGDQLREGDDRRWLSRMLWLLGRSAEADRQGHAALHALSELEPSTELAWAYVNLAHLAAYAQRTGDATRFARRAAELGDQLGEPAVVVRAAVHAAMARLLHNGEGWEELEAARDTAAAGGMEEHAGLAAIALAGMALLHRDLPRARAATEWAVRYCLDHDLMTFLLFADGVGAIELLHRGQWDRAADAASAVLSHPGASPVSRILPLTVLALVRARRGEPGVWPLLDEAAGLAEPGDLLRLGPVLEARAEAAWLAGDDEAARREAEAGLAAAPAECDPWVTGRLARWARRADGNPGAVRTVDAFALEAAGDWAAAARRWEQLGYRYDAALARLDADAEGLHEALAAFEALGAVRAAKRTRALLNRARGIDPHGLTPRELEVLALLREDLTDAEIGERLLISGKAAARHVAAILRKLGLPGRHHV